jgi:fructose-1,6-bisphosphatase I/sedoheptulose-1,7-bisphosphatase
MLNAGHTTLSKFLIEQIPDGAHARDLAALLVDVAAAVKAMSAAVGKGRLIGLPGLAASGTEQTTDRLGDELFKRGVEWNGVIAALVSRRDDSVRLVDGPGRLALLFDPLDRPANLELDAATGSLFSVHLLSDTRSEDALITRPADAQLAAGYAVYGPATQLVVTVGQGTHGFTLDREVGNFVLTHPDLRIPEDASLYLINSANRRFWEPPIARYVDECKSGEQGPRGRDFNTRWSASVVADVHRLLLRGGVYLAPRTQRDGQRKGRLEQLFVANPLAMLIEQAGGAASTGRGRLLDARSDGLHGTVPVILGSRAEVERIERYHREYDSGDDRPIRSPLFGERSLLSNV